MRTENIVNAVKQVFRKNALVSQRRMSSATGVSKTSIQRILKQDLKLYPYKFNYLIFSDEAHFYLNGMVNKQNSRYNSIKKPQLIKQTYRISLLGYHRSILFEDTRGIATTFNQDRYQDMLRGFWDQS